MHSRIRSSLLHTKQLHWQVELQTFYHTTCELWNHEYAANNTFYTANTFVDFIDNFGMFSWLEIASYYSFTWMALVDDYSGYFYFSVHKWNWCCQDTKIKIKVRYYQLIRIRWDEKQSSQAKRNSSFVNKKIYSYSSDQWKWYLKQTRWQ